MFDQSKRIFAYVGRHVTCVDLDTGAELWRTSIPSSSYHVGSLVVQNGRVVVRSSGVLHCLDAATGNLLWTNTLKGLGYGNIFLAGSASTQQTAAIVAQAAAGAVAATG